ncbi:MAG: FAD-dependent oxidoreductase, partial [Desulfocucumaceae bacterium]
MTVGKVGSVLVLGGGVAGIQASLDLAGSGFYVYLVERSPAIGGVMAQLDKTFPTNDCSMCILSPKLVESGRHTNIRLITNTSVAGLEGQAGDFKVTLRNEPRYVEADKCVGCGVCAEKCPVKVSDLFNERIGNRKAIYSKYAQAVPNTYAIDKDHCLFLTRGQTKGGKDVCKLCETVCETGAINFDQQVTEEIINVGAVIVASGFKRFNPSGLDYYGYGKFKNVVTSMELERILSASGPYQGHLIRPGDGAEPRRVAWIQCVGSRNLKEAGMSYCSAVCCTYAVKEAIVAKEHSVGDVDAAIFYIDMRAFGKDFEAYVDRAKTEYGVRFIKSRIYELEELPSGNLLMRYADEFGEVSTEEFDMVVLSVALKPADGTKELAEVLGIELNSHGFSAIPGMDITQSTREGIFVCGAVTGPQDIPDTVVQASAAAGSAAVFLSESRGSKVVGKDFPPERDIAAEEPKVGVFVCRCGINIGNVVDVTRVKDSIAGAKNVEYAGEFLYACSQDSQEKVKEAIGKYGLNRIVVASCTPRTHEELFRQTLRESGLNPFLFEMANIREHCSWVHSSNPGAATRKAMDLVSRAVQKVRMSEALEELTLNINRDALVIGGGVSGINAALELAGQGIKVYLLEKTDRLGGLTLRIKANLNGFNIHNYLEEIIEKVNSNPLIEIITEANIDGAWGHVGNFTTRVITREGTREINHGVAIIAIGGRESQPGEYLYGKDPRIMTGLQLDGAISRGEDIVAGAKTAVFIQCVGSRGDERSYCSRMCCSETVKNALELKELN